jgi:hypothetical protein
MLLTFPLPILFLILLTTFILHPLHRSQQVGVDLDMDTGHRHMDTDTWIWMHGYGHADTIKDLILDTSGNHF